MLQLKEITKNYYVANQEIRALDQVSVEFRKSEFVAILGASGSGKTTLLNIVGGLDKYTSGDLVISDMSTKKFKDRDWDNYRNKRVGFVFQNYNLISHLNVLENVELALTISGISPANRKALAKQALENVGLGSYLKNKPNQLSGGQMQRVAIARALVNSPDILLADEPTGALDSETSKQIIELIKQISKNKLVIMVTHNSQLAQKYANRIISLHDGKIVGDTRPYKSKQTKAQVNERAKTKKKGRNKTSMSFFTALALSFKNLFTKKARTIMVSIASSIGIIGVCLVLALSNGMNNYIGRLQSDTISSSPIIITEQVANPQAFAAIRAQTEREKFPIEEKIFVQERLRMRDFMRKNNLTQDYINFLNKNIKDEWVNDITYKNGIGFNLFTLPENKDEYIKVDQSQSLDPLSALIDGGSFWQQMPKAEFVESQYDILAGVLPQEPEVSDDPLHPHQVMLVVNEYNMLREEVLVALGLKSEQDTESKELDFSVVFEREYRLATNNQIYSKHEDQFFLKPIKNIDMQEALPLEIVGIARIKEEATSGVLGTGLVYLPSLAQWLLNQNKDSEIVNFAKSNPETNPFTAENYVATPSSSIQDQHKATLTALGGVNLPNEISIYAVDLAAKEQIKAVLEEYNSAKKEEDQVVFNDMSEMFAAMLGGMIDTVTYVLVGFSAISLVVSSIMIAILTYVSVIERTKEIGILRSIGARKKDVSRVFNAENFILGGLAGLLGVGMTYLLSIPINRLLKNMVGVSGIASLAIPTALIMVLVSLALCVVAGFLPAKKAAKKDPVLALRTE